MAWWLLLALPALWLFILLLFARPILAAWREPVLRYPVLIIESDDWGPGPESHAQALRRLIACLNQYRDSTGRAPVMTLGLTLSLPDSDVIRSEMAKAALLPLPQEGEGATSIESAQLIDFPHPTPSPAYGRGPEGQSGITLHPAKYHARLITDPAYAEILTTIQEGIEAGVFAPQLHGMAHYWPDALMRAAQYDPPVHNWVLSGPGQETEALPSPLQSRWVDTSILPSHPLPTSAINTAVAEEITLYRNVFGAIPGVVVPPTFIWTDAVEAAWAAHGVRCIVTPGRLCTGRNANGQPDCGAPTISNGQRGIDGITYLVRDRYFEPDRGHRAEDALTALTKKTAQGRPCLLETHRFNFTGAGVNNALQQLGKLLELVLAQQPNLRFTSSAELAEQYRTHGDWLSANLKQRFAIWTRRIQSIPRFAKLARLSGLMLILTALQFLDRTAPT